MFVPCGKNVFSHWIYSFGGKETRKSLYFLSYFSISFVVVIVVTLYNKVERRHGIEFSICRIFGWHVCGPPFTLKYTKTKTQTHKKFQMEQNRDS